MKRCPRNVLTKKIIGDDKNTKKWHLYAEADIKAMYVV